MADQTQEEWALIAFINAREPGNLLRDIAIRTLKDLSFKRSHFTLPIKRAYATKAVKVRHIPSGKEYESLSEASAVHDIPLGSFSRAIRYNTKQYPFEKI